MRFFGLFFVHLSTVDVSNERKDMRGDCLLCRFTLPEEWNLECSALNLALCESEKPFLATHTAPAL